MKITSIGERVRLFSADLSGVFSFSDLWALTGLGSSDRVAKIATSLVREGILMKVRRGLYVTADADPWVLAGRLRECCCISLDSALARAGVIGTVPARSVSAVSTGNSKTVTTPLGRIRFFKIKSDLLFGFQTPISGVAVADTEKAYLDLLYYYVKGARFVVDPMRDVDVWKLDRRKISKYLRQYKNPKFRTFVTRILEEKFRARA